MQHFSSELAFAAGRIGRWLKLLKKARQAKRDLLLQAKVGRKLDGYIDAFVMGRIAHAPAVAKKPDLVGKKIIWQFWQQGVDEHTPPIVRLCLNSVKKYSNGYEVIVLSKDTLTDYVDELPGVVWQKFGAGGFDFPKIANLVRLQLLSAYGGVWLDATIFLTGPLEESWLQPSFFALQRSDEPPADASFFHQRDPLFFNWDPASQVKLLNSFIVAKPHHKIIDDLLAIHFAYWEKEEQINHYFFFQILFNRMMRHGEWKGLNSEIVGHTACHKLQLVAFDRFDRNAYDEVLGGSNLHKLSLYLSRKKLPEGSFVDVMMKTEGGL